MSGGGELAAFASVRSEPVDRPSAEGASKPISSESANENRVQGDPRAGIRIGLPQSTTIVGTWELTGAISSSRHTILAHAQPIDPQGFEGEVSVGTESPARPVETSNLSAHASRTSNSSADGSHYVVKVARSEAPYQEQAAGLVRRESRLLNGLDHQHIVPVLDSHETSGPCYFVMPNVGASTLANPSWSSSVRSKSKTAILPICESIWLIRQAATGLQYLHEQGWCHLDVKPHNIVLSSAGHVTLIDLALAQPIGKQYRSIPISGTSRYLAPERRSQLGSVAPAADIYSLGIVLLELLIGSHTISEDEDATIDVGEASSWQQRLGLSKKQRHDQLVKSHLFMPRKLIDLIDEMLSSIPERRPSLNHVFNCLINLEIETLKIEAS